MIFGEKKSIVQGAADTILGEKAKIKGELFSTGSVSVNGEFEGKLSAEEEVIIARRSKVVGNVSGGNVIVSGKVEGNISASQNLEITKYGRVHGDLTGGSISIEEGSSYRGRVRVEGEGSEEELEVVQEATRPEASQIKMI